MTTTHLPSEELPCIFCKKLELNRSFDKILFNEDRSVVVHYLCLLFSSGLAQRSVGGSFEGFLEPDILKEHRRGYRSKCCYCKEINATIGCSKKRCPRSFHFKCGEDNNALFQFFGTFSSFCEEHRAQQTIVTNPACSICLTDITTNNENQNKFCTIFSPCCKVNYHKECVQKQAESSGEYFFKCACCNNKKIFMSEMLKQGIYIPSRDAQWELEPGAFSELLLRYCHCDSIKCRANDGRNYSRDKTRWEIIVCQSCGSCGTHYACQDLPLTCKRWTCSDCSEIEKSLKKKPKKKNEDLSYLKNWCEIKASGLSAEDFYKLRTPFDHSSLSANSLKLMKSLKPLVICLERVTTVGVKSNIIDFTSKSSNQSPTSLSETKQSSLGRSTAQKRKASRNYFLPGRKRSRINKKASRKNCDSLEAKNVDYEKIINTDSVNKSYDFQESDRSCPPLNKDSHTQSNNVNLFDDKISSESSDLSYLTDSINRGFTFMSVESETNTSMPSDEILVDTKNPNRLSSSVNINYEDFLNNCSPVKNVDNSHMEESPTSFLKPAFEETKKTSRKNPLKLKNSQGENKENSIQFSNRMTLPTFTCLISKTMSNANNQTLMKKNQNLVSSLKQSLIDSFLKR